MSPTLVLLAAGLSTRFGRLKQLEPVGPGGESLLDYSVHDAHAAGFRRVVLIVRRELEAVFRSHVLESWPDDLEVVVHHQALRDLPESIRASVGTGEVDRLLSRRGKPWGTAHALLTARRHLSGPFAVVNADDFYGAAAFVQAVSLLEQNHAGAGGALRGDDRGDEAERGSMDVPLFGLVAYRLENTLSDHGGVSRGICRVGRHGWLQEVEEVLEIRRKTGTIVGRTLLGEGVMLGGEEPVSTNFWAFTPELFPFLELGFARFLRRLARHERREGEPDGGKRGGSRGEPEFLIPPEVTRVLASRDARVRVVEATSEFFGITHPEDREWVAGRLAELARQGRYRVPLWG